MICTILSNRVNQKKTYHRCDMGPSSVWLHTSIKNTLYYLFQRSIMHYHPVICWEKIQNIPTTKRTTCLSITIPHPKLALWSMQTHLHHRWDLPVLRYQKIMVIYPYSFLVAITQLFSNIIFINDCICILTGSPR